MGLRWYASAWHKKQMNLFCSALNLIVPLDKGTLRLNNKNKTSFYFVLSSTCSTFASWNNDIKE